MADELPQEPIFDADISGSNGKIEVSETAVSEINDTLNDDTHIAEELTQVNVNQSTTVMTTHKTDYRTDKPQDVLIWQVEKGSDLRKTMASWCKKQNIELSWNNPLDYKIDKDVFISGTFENAVEVLFSKGLVEAPLYQIKTSPHYAFTVMQ